MAELRKIVLPALVLVLTALAWELSVKGGIAPSTIAAPSNIAAELGGRLGLLWYHLEPTLLIASSGLFAALVLSFVVAGLVYLVRGAEPTVLTLGAFVSSIPMIAIAPVLVIWMGLSVPTRITIATIICFFPILIAILQGLKAAPQTAEELFTNLAARPLQRFRLLALPYALPYLFVGLKIAAPLSILGALIAEWTGAERGLGVFILNAMFGLKVVELWTGVLTACTVSMSAFALVSLFEALTRSGPHTSEEAST